MWQRQWPPFLSLRRYFSTVQSDKAPLQYKKKDETLSLVSGALRVQEFMRRCCLTLIVLARQGASDFFERADGPFLWRYGDEKPPLCGMSE